MTAYTSPRTNSLILAQLTDLHSGFLPTRGSFMLDFVCVAMIAIIVVLTLSIFLVRQKKRYRLHKRIQIGTALVLLVTILAFEIDVRFLSDWREMAEPSRFYESGVVDWALAIHLLFAIPTPFVWIFTVIMAVRKFPADPRPSAYSPRHRFWGWASALLMYLTAITGWIFYVLAFVL